MITKSEVNKMINSVLLFQPDSGVCLVDSGALDSFSILVFVSNLHTEYGIEISIDENTRDIFTSVDSIYEYITTNT